MTIKELCDKHKHCVNCPIERLCSYLDFYDSPLNKINDEDNELITNAIIETAKMLKSTNTEQQIRENLKSLTTYRVPNSNTDLVSLKAVERVLNLVFRGNRESEV